jgi:hypothetical protein
MGFIFLIVYIAISPITILAVDEFKSVPGVAQSSVLVGVDDTKTASGSELSLGMQALMNDSRLNDPQVKKILAEFNSAFYEERRLHLAWCERRAPCAAAENAKRGIIKYRLLRLSLRCPYDMCINARCWRATIAHTRANDRYLKQNEKTYRALEDFGFMGWQADRLRGWEHDKVYNIIDSEIKAKMTSKGLGSVKK